MHISDLDVHNSVTSINVATEIVAEPNTLSPEGRIRCSAGVEGSFDIVGKRVEGSDGCDDQVITDNTEDVEMEDTDVVLGDLCMDECENQFESLEEKKANENEHRADSEIISCISLKEQATWRCQ